MARPAGATLVLATAIALAAVLSSAALASPVPAKGAPTFEVQKRSLDLELLTEASNGYAGFISTKGHKRVTLTLLKQGATVVVVTTGRVSRHGIEAKFGDLGQVSVRFKGKRIPWEGKNSSRGRGAAQQECRGRKPVVESGTFRGTIRFRGENDFTRIDARVTAGTVARHYRRVCEADPPSRGDGAFEELFEKLDVTLLRAVGRGDGATVSFEASAVDFGAIFGFKMPTFNSFRATSIERVDGMRIIRVLSADGDKRSFVASGKKARRASATAVPPTPFAGRGNYFKQVGAPAAWTGPLTVRLPGLGSTELTSPSFAAVLCHGRFKALREGGCQPNPKRIAPAPPSTPTGFSSSGLSSGQRLPVPGLLRRKALLVEVAAKLR